MDKLEARMDGLEVRMDKLEARLERLEEKVDKLATAVAELRAGHLTVLWVCGGFISLVVAAVTIGKAVGWIGPPESHPGAMASALSAPLVPHHP
jgi:hypothetical protein